MRNLRLPIRSARLAMLMLLFATSAQAGEVVLERPASLRPAIGFWTRVYSQIDTLSGFVHDSENLAVVYEKLDLNWYDSPQIQDKLIAKTLNRYRKALRALADGKREDLTPTERKTLALWGDGADAATFKDAAERIRFQRGQSDRVREGIVRAGAWEKRIRKTLRDAGLPEELAALPHVESSYDPEVSSHAGAVGLWQFTDFTGRHYLRVDSVLDERLDPVKSTDGAVRLLKKYYSKLESWPLAITAYNHGLSGVRRAVRDTGSTDIGVIVKDYKGPRFGFASRNYYAAFLAAGDVTRNAEKYFGKLERTRGENYWVVKVPNYLEIDALVEQLALDTDVLKALNPALQPSVWSGGKYVPKGYLLRLPVSTDSTTITALLTRVPGHAEQIPDMFYRVKAGDTLSGIALRHNHTVRELIALNNLRDEHHIIVGQSLRLYRAKVPEAIQIAAMETARGDKALLRANRASLD